MSLVVKHLNRAGGRKSNLIYAHGSTFNQLFYDLQCLCLRSDIWFTPKDSGLTQP